MNSKYRAVTFLIIISFIFTLLVDPKPALAQGIGKSMTILFTHDLHDHLLPVKDLQDGSVISSGGFARLQSAILEEKRKSPDALLLDAGDFSMGTPFQTIFQTDAPELRLLGDMGYDAVTFGNHEYDYRALGLAESLNAAMESGDRLPQVVQSNVVFPADDNGELTLSLAALNKAYEDLGVKDYTVIERNGIRVGIFGIMGKDAAYKAPMSEVEFSDPVESARRVADELKNKEGADLIICLSHTGTWEDGKEPGDDDLAKKVPGIDVIISGHSHTIYPEPLVVGGTIIASAGDSCRYLGILKVSQDAGSGWRLKDYRLRRIDDQLPDDICILEMINGYKELVQQKYFDRFNLDFDQVLAVSPFNFRPQGEISDSHGEDTLGNLISDAYINAVKQVEGEDYVTIDAAVVPVGTIRGSFYKGEITTADAFNVSSLGIGADGTPGYPLISVYLTGKELKTACEVDASVAPMMDVAQLFISGVDFTFNPNRLIFNKVTEAYLRRPDGSREEIQDEKLYRVVAGLYSAQMLSIVGDKSFGLMSIVPKTDQGVPITDLEAHIIKDTAGGGELKEWLAIAMYLQSFDRVNGIPHIPEYYSKAQGRKVVNDSRNLFDIISSPNGIALAVYAIAILVVVIVTVVVLRVVARRKRLKSTRAA
jgi:2',3'-cyclic-nucleotide 2'-phosphodiesterase (5'-nucleotidase family)